ncbi:hypothetical protein [Leptospira hartskeerlii]|uniref:hypothetical protein n=1 Tax=Leptospira hartskeerlii TaxID=2023177 RepID=UPI0013FD38E4|nr:hypothetical protein [Leptospira hartskeerlii]
MIGAVIQTYVRHVPDGNPTGETSKFTPEQKALYKERLDFLKRRLLLQKAEK